MSIKFTVSTVTEFDETSTEFLEISEKKNQKYSKKSNLFFQFIYLEVRANIVPYRKSVGRVARDAMHSPFLRSYPPPPHHYILKYSRDYFGWSNYRLCSRLQFSVTFISNVFPRFLFFLDSIYTRINVHFMRLCHTATRPSRRKYLEIVTYRVSVLFINVHNIKSIKKNNYWSLIWHVVINK